MKFSAAGPNLEQPEQVLRTGEFSHVQKNIFLDVELDIIPLPWLGKALALSNYSSVAGHDCSGKRTFCEIGGEPCLCQTSEVLQILSKWVTQMLEYTTTSFK